RFLTAPIPSDTAATPIAAPTRLCSRSVFTLGMIRLPRRLECQEATRSALRASSSASHGAGLGACGRDLARERLDCEWGRALRFVVYQDEGGKALLGRLQRDRDHVAAHDSIGVDDPIE